MGLKAIKLLYVEDDLEVAEALQSTLRLLVHTLYIAHNGQEKIS